MRSFVETLVDQQITAIEQASDYVQFRLGLSATLTVFNPIRSESPLARLVGRTIKQVDIRPDEVVFVVT